MSLFKVFQRILRSVLPNISIFFGVFLGISIATSLIAPREASSDFTQARTKTAVINRDGDTPLARGLIAYLQDRAALVNLPDDLESQQDALFFQEVEYIVYLPAGFSEGYEKGSPAAVETAVLPASTSAQYMNLLLDRYLNSAQVLSQYGRLRGDALASAVAEALAAQADVEVVSAQKTSSASLGFSTFFFRYIAYAMLSVVILGISTILMVFNQPDLNRRNLCAPVSSARRNTRLGLYCSLFSLSVWAVSCLLGLILYGRLVISLGIFPYHALNALMLTLVCAAGGYLVGLLIRSYNVQSAIANTVSLGLCFISGVFVEQDLMSPAVLKIASLFPVYWYVRAGSLIGDMPALGELSLAPIAAPLLVQLGYAVVLFLTALLLARRRSRG